MKNKTSLDANVYYLSMEGSKCMTLNELNNKIQKSFLTNVFVNMVNETDIMFIVSIDTYRIHTKG